MTIDHLFGFFLKRIYVKEASRKTGLHKLLVYLSKPCPGGWLLKHKPFQPFYRVS